MPMSSTDVPRRRMTLLDATLLVGSAAVGLGLYELAHRTLFKGWIWLTDQGIPDVRTWSTMEALVTLSDITVFLLPVVAPWTVLLLLLRMRSAPAELAADLATARHGRMPGCPLWLALDAAWCCCLAMNVDRVARSSKTITADVGRRSTFRTRSSCTSAWPWRPPGSCNT